MCGPPGPQTCRKMDPMDCCSRWCLPRWRIYCISAAEVVDAYLVVVRGGEHKRAQWPAQGRRRRGPGGRPRPGRLPLIIYYASKTATTRTPGTRQATMEPYSLTLPTCQPQTPQRAGPFGPPPPRPDRPRSRSPHRAGTAAGPAPPGSATPQPSDSAEGMVTLQLADHVEAPVFNIDCNTAPLPHDPATGRRLTTPWQFDWLRFDPEALAIKEVTRQPLTT